MEVILLRHGRPDLKQNHKLKARELYKWIQNYNASGIDQSYSPTQKTMAMAQQCNRIVCSDYRRSTESAKLLGLQKIDLIDPLFREAGLPYANWNTIHARPETWATLFRILWFTGYHPNSESYSDCKVRSQKAARKLETLAEDSGIVLFIGHVFINRFIIKQLLSRGWQTSSTYGTNHWSFSRFEK